jgi:hypothetical protein
LMRLLMQMLDKLEQVDRAIIHDDSLRNQVRNCKHLIKDRLQGIGVY